MASQSSGTKAMTSKPEIAPLRSKLGRDFPHGVRRSCGYPACTVILRIPLIDQPNSAPTKETSGGKQNLPLYCDVHQSKANTHRRSLRNLIAKIDEAIAEGHLVRNRKKTKDHPGTVGFTKADLERWRSLLLWELRGMPGSQDEFLDPSSPES